MAYYNTTNLEADDLRAARAQTMKQDDVILEIFQYYPNWSYTPGQIARVARLNFNKNYPITSVRRSIHTLTKAGKLRKTRELRNCIYGKKAHCWILAGERSDRYSANLEEEPNFEEMCQNNMEVSDEGIF